MATDKVPPRKARRTPSPRKLARFTQTPNTILYNRSLTTADRIVYMALIDHGEESFPAHQYLADILGIGRRTAMRSIERLIELGIVQKQSRGYRRTNIYKTKGLAELTPKGHTGHEIGHTGLLTRATVASQHRPGWPTEVEPLKENQGSRTREGALEDLETSSLLDKSESGNGEAWEDSRGTSDARRLPHPFDTPIPWDDPEPASPTDITKMTSGIAGSSAEHDAGANGGAQRPVPVSVPEIDWDAGKTP